MGRKKGTFSLSANLEVKAAAPLDPRELVDTLEDLTANDTFPYPFEGLEVYVKSEQKKYMLIGSDPTVESNWVQAGGEGGAKIFKGTVEEWNALTLEEKITYDYTVFTDDNAGGGAAAAESGFVVYITQDENSGNLVPDKTKEELDQAIADGQEILAKVVGSEYFRIPLTDHQDSVFSFEAILGYGQDTLIGGISIDYSENPVQVSMYQKENVFSGEFNHDKIIYSTKVNNNIDIYDPQTNPITPKDLKDFETSDGYFVLSHNGIWYSYRGQFPQGFKFESNQKTVYLVPKEANDSEWEDIIEEDNKTIVNPVVYADTAPDIDDYEDGALVVYSGTDAGDFEKGHTYKADKNATSNLYSWSASSSVDSRQLSAYFKVSSLSELKVGDEYYDNKGEAHGSVTEVTENSFTTKGYNQYTSTPLVCDTNITISDTPISVTMPTFIDLGGGGEKTFTGTQAAWEALSAEEKAKYDGKVVNITDDCLGVDNYFVDTTKFKNIYNENNDTATATEAVEKEDTLTIPENGLYQFRIHITNLEAGVASNYISFSINNIDMLTVSQTSSSGWTGNTDSCALPLKAGTIVKCKYHFTVAGFRYNCSCSRIG